LKFIWSKETHEAQELPGTRDGTELAKCVVPV